MSETRPTKQAVNSVRQVLMNELGLTRESVREMVREVAIETAEKYIRSSEFWKEAKGAIGKEVHQERIKAARTLERPNPYVPFKSFTDFIQDEVKRELRKLVDSLDLSISVSASKSDTSQRVA